MDSQWSGDERRRDVKELNELASKLMSLHEDVSEIKGALRDLTSAITKLALIEERQTVTNASLERAFGAISRVEDRLSELERLQPINNQSRLWVERFVLAVAGAALMFIWDQVKK
jgi:predicted nuclease with TOPRIM domain